MKLIEHVESCRMIQTNTFSQLSVGFWSKLARSFIMIYSDGIIFFVILHEDFSTSPLNETICHLCRFLNMLIFRKKYSIWRQAVFSPRRPTVTGAVFVVEVAVILLPWRHLRVALRRSRQRALKLMTAGFLETTGSRSDVVFPSWMDKNTRRL